MDGSSKMAWCHVKFKVHYFTHFLDKTVYFRAYIFIHIFSKQLICISLYMLVNGEMLNSTDDNGSKCQRITYPHL